MIKPYPWWQVGLAILPGVVIFVATNLEDLGWQVRLPGFVALSFIVLLGMSSVVWALVRRHPLDIGVWGLAPLGLLSVFGVFELGNLFTHVGRPLGAGLKLLLGYGLLLAILVAMFGRTFFARILAVIGYTLAPALLVLLFSVCMTWLGWGSVEIYHSNHPVTGLVDWSGVELYAELFLLVVVGMPFARYRGLAAGLFVLAGGLILMSWHIEQEVFFWDHRVLSNLLEAALTLLFFVVAPIWVLYTGSLLGQTAGLLVPVLAYAALLVSALCAARGFPVGQSISIASPAFVLCTALGAAIVLYPWTAERGQGPIAW